MALGVAFEELLSNADLQVEIMLGGESAHENENVCELVGESLGREGFVVRRPGLLQLAGDFSDFLDEKRDESHRVGCEAARIPLRGDLRLELGEVSHAGIFSHHLSTVAPGTDPDRVGQYRGMHIVCLCGSVRYKQEFLAAQEAESLRGRVVLAPGVFSKADGRALTDDQIQGLHALHRRKIELADELVVIAPDERIGESTAEEIAYGRSLGKPVRYWEPDGQRSPIDPVQALEESHRAQRLLSSDSPTLDVPDEVKSLRCALIEEEAREFRDALEADDIVGVADAIADLLYVVYGAARTFGIPVREVFAEVHRSNMTKLDENGKAILRADGKVMKGPNYSPPDLLPLLRSAGLRA